MPKFRQKLTDGEKRQRRVARIHNKNSGGPRPPKMSDAEKRKRREQREHNSKYRG